jgi:hypothetical protein
MIHYHPAFRCYKTCAVDKALLKVNDINHSLRDLIQHINKFTEIFASDGM